MNLDILNKTLDLDDRWYRVGQEVFSGNGDAKVDLKDFKFFFDLSKLSISSLISWKFLNLE